MDSDLYHCLVADFENIALKPVTTEIIFTFLILILLIALSALVSGSESALFSLNPSEIEDLEKRETPASKRVLANLDDRKKLLATILIANNFINVSIVMLSAMITNLTIDFGDATAIKFIFETIIITTLILFFGEIMPKILSLQNRLSFAEKVSAFIAFLLKILSPFSRLLISSTSVVDKRLAERQKNISIDDLSQAIELTQKDIGEEKKLLRGIVSFTNLSVADIMTPRVDVVCIDISEPYSKVLEIAVNAGNSRIPVYEETLDEIRGILFVKDLLPNLEKDNNFDWKTILREPFFVPESKKINVLLNEFQAKKTHLAIVVDEYGGMSGIVTLEDILEEIVGEIHDEMEVENEVLWEKKSDGSIIFEAKISLNDFFKITAIDPDKFEDSRGEAETLAGFLLELNGLIPKKGEIISYDIYKFVVLEADNRKITRVRFLVQRK